MESIDFTAENLFKLGLTPEILKTDFENWLFKNDDFVVDFDSKKIHIGKYKLNRKLKFSLALIKKELTDEGMSDSEIDEYLSEIKSNLKPKLDQELSNFPDDLKKEFLIKSLISTSEKLFKINDQAIKSISDNLLDGDLLSDDFENFKQELSKTINTNETETMIFNENLTNDPLYNPANEYSILKEKFIEEYQSRTAHLKDANDFFIQDVDLGFQDWEEKQQEEIKNAFLKLIKELNHTRTFFFGCSFDNYHYNYEKRLKSFLENYTDTVEYDFIEDELKFLENILYDIQNSEAAHDGYAQSGYEQFSKAYDFVSITGYKQYFFSHNKKETFLNKRMFELTSEEKLKDVDALYNHKTTDKDQINKIEIKNNNSNTIVQIKEKKPAEKWYALLYLLELKATNTKPPTNYEGDFIRKDIEEIGKKRTGTTGQSFYRECLKINEIINNNSLLEKSFDKDWKQKIIAISNNDELIISYLNSFS